MNKRILIIGGTGMLGSPVAQQFRAKGYTVRIFTRSPEKARDICENPCAIKILSLI
jgi:nucleoside-diphosphate-sugar epimerase